MKMKALFHLHREQRGMGVGLDCTANSEDADLGKKQQQNQRVKMLRAHTKIHAFCTFFTSHRDDRCISL